MNGNPELLPVPVSSSSHSLSGIFCDFWAEGNFFSHWGNFRSIIVALHSAQLMDEIPELTNVAQVLCSTMKKCSSSGTSGTAFCRLCSVFHPRYFCPKFLDCCGWAKPRRFGRKRRKLLRSPLKMVDFTQRLDKGHRHVNCMIELNHSEVLWSRHC